ncbi:phosphopantetheine-binding protein [Nocardiopsis sp. CNT312]|uniref:phosphopantetheine-binding protein n=1 Tax=Nocardiopsis sp. CNT312 TaxID=1137268 RepID=UPI00048DFB91|nr:phosphopantetheine-binding protein [Nocardiopsis sp. CNT312]
MSQDHNAGSAREGELTAELVREHVATTLGESPESIGDTDNLLDQGMDSIRLMSLVEIWRGYGVETDFIALAEDATLQAWQRLLTGR